MDIYTATEQAYKNGYEAGVKSQQAEIEKLKKDIQESDILIDMQDKALQEQTAAIEELKETKDRLMYNLKAVCKEQDEGNIRADAIKEFADKLDTYIMWHFPIDDPFVADIRLKVSMLAKEMEGDSE